MNKLIVICGATATGKSGLALKLATKLSSIILSADSRQVYREFDIGTAKPSSQEQSVVPHYLIDICNPTDTLTVADYQQQAQEIISSSANNLPSSSPICLVGGTGLYIKSITKGLIIPRVPPQAQLRSQLESIGQTRLYPMLEQVDPVSAQKIHAHDLVRTLRALEVFYTTGFPISELQGENPPEYPILQIGLDCNSQYLTDRIACRVDLMIKNGFVEEVKYLCEKYGSDLPLLNTLGYQEIKLYLSGNISLQKAKELTILHTRQFAKRQRTWFKKVKEIEWFDIQSPDLFAKVWLRIEKFLIDNN